jgi:competence protein ComEA
MKNLYVITKQYFFPLVKKLRRYVIEIILILTATIISLLSIHYNQKYLEDEYNLSKSQQIQNSSKIMADPTTDLLKIAKIKIDISGAIEKPGIYTASEGARLGEVIELAGGLTYEADHLFVGRNFNLAKILNDQDKIYVPHKFEIAMGTFVEEKTRLLSYLQPAIAPENDNQESIDQEDETSLVLISLNEASAEELDVLPKIGPVTAEKIIDNRPYADINELLERRVINQSTFEEIKDLIQL